MVGPIEDSLHDGEYALVFYLYIEGTFQQSEGRLDRRNSQDKKGVKEASEKNKGLLYPSQIEIRSQVLWDSRSEPSTRGCGNRLARETEENSQRFSNIVSEEYAENDRRSDQRIRRF